MVSPQIKVLISLAVVSSVYAFVCQIRLSQKAGKLSQRVLEEYPDLWADLNPVARSWNGGYPGLKLLYRRNVVGLSKYDREYKQLQSLERQLIWGVVIGAVCIGLVILGSRVLDWAI